MEYKLLEFTCNQDAFDSVSFEQDQLTGLLWITVHEDGAISQMCINKIKAEQLRDWLTKQLDSQP